MDAGNGRLLRIKVNMDLQWTFARGRCFGEFYRQLRQGRMMGIRCPACGRVYLPPRPVCGNCYVELHDWVAVGPQGTIRAFTVVYLPIVDPITGQPRPVPYAMALIQPDGADTTVNHYIDRTDPEHLAIGLRVEAVFRPERRGNMSDIMHFRVLEA